MDRAVFPIYCRLLLVLYSRRVANKAANLSYRPSIRLYRSTVCLLSVSGLWFDMDVWLSLICRMNGQRPLHLTGKQLLTQCRGLPLYWCSRLIPLLVGRYSGGGLSKRCHRLTLLSGARHGEIGRHCCRPNHSRPSSGTVA